MRRQAAIHRRKGLLEGLRARPSPAADHDQASGGKTAQLPGEADLVPMAQPPSGAVSAEANSRNRADGPATTCCSLAPINLAAVAAAQSLPDTHSGEAEVHHRLPDFAKALACSSHTRPTEHGLCWGTSAASAHNHDGQICHNAWPNSLAQSSHASNSPGHVVAQGSPEAMVPCRASVHVHMGCAVGVAGCESCRHVCGGRQDANWMPDAQPFHGWTPRPSAARTLCFADGGRAVCPGSTPPFTCSSLAGVRRPHLR